MALSPNPMPTTSCQEPSNQPDWGGACALRMTLLSQTLQQQPFPVKDTADIYNLAHQHNSLLEPANLWALDPDAVTWTLNDQDPHDSVHVSSSTYCYRTHAVADQNSAIAELRKALDDYNMLVCTLRADGRDWVAISGYILQNNALLGFFVDDPNPMSGGPDVWNSITYWKSVWTPVVPQSPTWQGKYVIVRDDREGEFPAVSKDQPIGRPRPRPWSPTELISADEAGRLAIDGARGDQLDQYPRYAAALRDGTPGKPLLVHDADHGAAYYYLVPLIASGADPQGDPTQTPTVGAIAIDAHSGNLMTAFVNDQPAPLFNVTPSSALNKLASEGFPLSEELADRVMVPRSTIMVNPLLVYSATADTSPFRPFFQAVSGAYVAYVSTTTGETIGSLKPTGVILGG